ncbi:MAG TPA: hypothetical protein VK843_08165 [Planctomycetota bacterium]|nr:hypothetical protein [Planctomycetota bacterium]
MIRSPILITLSSIFLATLTAPAPAQSSFIGWGGQVFDGRIPSQTFIRISSGYQHTLAMRPDGTAVGWGVNTYGLCDVPVLLPGLSFADISTSDRHVAAVLSDGSVIAWGNNSSGACTVPALPAGLTAVEVACGGDGSSAHTVIRLSDGTLMAWGSSFEGQLALPTLQPGQQFVKITAGGVHTSGLVNDGTIYTWGDNHFGQCNVPLPAPGLVYTDVSAGQYHTLALRSDGSVFAYGRNVSGECNVPTLPAGLTYTSISAGHYHSTAVRSDGAIVAWGYGADGQCQVPSPPPGLSWTRVTAGGRFTSGVRSDGRLIEFGKGPNMPVFADGVDAVEVAPGLVHNVARGSDGSIAYWDTTSFSPFLLTPPAGRSCVQISSAGQAPGFLLMRLDDGSVIAGGFYDFHGVQLVPALPVGVRYVDVEASFHHSIALRSDGTAVAWGQNNFGQCNLPALPAGMTYVDASVGQFSTLVLRSDGVLLGCGAPQGGILNVPTLPAGVTYTSIDAGFYHAVAMCSDGSVQMWGDNLSGQCTAPALPNGMAYTEVVAGSYTTLARRSDGALIGFGEVSGVRMPLAGSSFAEIENVGNVFVARLEGAVPLPVSYCTAKLNALGCLPSMRWNGIPSASAGSGFTIQCVNARNQKPGLLLYSLTGQATFPAHGAILCVNAPIRRALGVSSGGSASGDDCSGILATDFNAFAVGALGGNPSLALQVPGTVVDAQYWGRDPGFAAPNNSMLSNGLHFTMGN